MVRMATTQGRTLSAVCAPTSANAGHVTRGKYVRLFSGTPSPRRSQPAGDTPLAHGAEPEGRMAAYALRMVLVVPFSASQCSHPLSGSQLTNSNQDWSSSC
jgi:hypothetical protein